MTTTDPKRIAIVGATGSIGRSTCDVVRRGGDAYDVVALAAGSDVARLAPLAKEFRPALVAVSDASARPALEDALRGTGIRVEVGADAIDAVAAFPAADIVVNAAVGAAGLRPTVAAVEAGKTIALANKESLVLAGAFLVARARANGAAILPVDSEHASLLQCLWGRDPASVHALVLTASGGPFRQASEGDLANVTPARALEHPTWKMGPRITIDSATLMNKGFEVIEARWLFDMPQNRIRVVVHPQSIVHGLVELSDGSMLAHMGEPDMRLPIAAALAHPEPSATRLRPLSLSEVGTLTFEEPDRRRFPCLALAEVALKAGGTMPAVLNAADEVAVSAFLGERIRFVDIPSVIESTMSEHEVAGEVTLAAVFDADRWARDAAERHIQRRSAPRAGRLGA